MLNQSEDLWCHGYNMRTGVTGIFPAFYAIKVAKEGNQGIPKRLQKQNMTTIINIWLLNVSLSSYLVSAQKDGWIDKFLVRFLGSVQVPIHKGNDVLCAAMQKVREHGHWHGRNTQLELTISHFRLNGPPSGDQSHRMIFARSLYTFQKQTVLHFWYFSNRILNPLTTEP